MHDVPDVVPLSNSLSPIKVLLRRSTPPNVASHT